MASRAHSGKIDMKVRLLPLAIGLVLAGSLSPHVMAADIPADSSNLLITTGTSLEDFFTATLNNSPELAIARERWSIGTARKDQATVLLLPQISASGTLSDNERTDPRVVTETYRGERYGFSISQVLFHWAAFQNRKQASLLEDQSEAEYFATL